MLVFGLYAVFVSAQVEEAPSDTTVIRELKLTRYDPDTTADAVVLSSVVNISLIDIGQGYRRYTTVKQRIRIMSDAGVHYGTVHIPLYNKGNAENEVSAITGIAYNLEDGKVVISQLEKKDLYTEKVTEGLTSTRFAIPKVKAGSLVYISYTVKSNDMNCFSWSFQEDIPVAYCKLSFSVPPLLIYKLNQQKMNGFVQTDEEGDQKQLIGAYEYKSTKYCFTGKNIEAFKDGSYMASVSDYLVRISFQLSKYRNAQTLTTISYMDTWPDFTKKVIDNDFFGGFMQSKPGEIKDIVKELKLHDMPQVLKVKKIVEYVRNSYAWNGVTAPLAQKKMKDFLDQKSGSSAEINLLLIALCNEAKLNALPILISTRGHGMVSTDYPFLESFNDVICLVKTDSLSVLLDATERNLPFYAIPLHCINGYGFVVERDSVKWVALQPKVLSQVDMNMYLEFNGLHDSIHASIIDKTQGYDAFIYRRTWHLGYDNFLKVHTPKNWDIIDSLTVKNTDQPDEPFIFSYKASEAMNRTEGDSGSSPGHLSFPPLLAAGFTDNPIKMDSRKYPIDMTFKHSYIFHSTIAIPDGYKLEEKPADYSYMMKDGGASFLYNVKVVSDGILQVYSTISFNQAVFPAEDFACLKKFYDEVIKKYREQVVLVKKN